MTVDQDIYAQLRAIHCIALCIAIDAATCSAEMQYSKKCLIPFNFAPLGLLA